jgi:hypothetical protein
MYNNDSNESKSSYSDLREVSALLLLLLLLLMEEEDEYF